MGALPRCLGSGLWLHEPCPHLIGPNHHPSVQAGEVRAVTSTRYIKVTYFLQVIMFDISADLYQNTKFKTY